MNNKISSYFPPPSPPDPPKKPSMGSPIPPDKPKKSKRPKADTIETYDYGDMCNKKRCKDKPVECPTCLKKGIRRLAHRKVWLGNAKNRTSTQTEIFTVYVHGHFALRKGTKAPAMSEARNVSCEKENSRRMINIEENCELALRLKGRKKLPEWLRRYINGEDND